ncbi:MAG: isochorismatase family cysteine hydrolase [Pseudomonadota bacterium]
MTEAHPALLLIDLVEDYLSEGVLGSKRQALASAVNALTAQARQRDIPIIWIRQEFEGDLSDAFQVMREQNIRVTIKGTPGCQLIPELEREASDHEIIKKRYSAFFRTELDELLTQLGCHSVVVGGVNTHACVRMAAVDAYQRDYHVFLATDCVASYDAQFHEETLRYLEQSIAQCSPNDVLINEVFPA